MRQVTSPSERVAVWFTAMVAPRDMREALIGDMLEHADASQKPVWRIAALGLPHTLLHRMERFAVQARPQDAIYVVLFIGLLLMWEYGIAREWAWPFARNMLHLTSMSAAHVCMGAYILLYFGFAFACGKVLSQIGAANLVSSPAKFVMRIIVFIPAMAFMIAPTSVDGSLFRLYQIFAVLIGFVVATISWRRTFHFAWQRFSKA